MTCGREHWKEMLPIIQAFVDGKTLKVGGAITNRADFTGSPNSYAIVEPPKLRPWRQEEFQLDAWFRFTGNKGLWLKALSINEEAAMFLPGQERTYVELLRCFEHSIDGGKTWLRCGVEVNE
jgi:hypothetical protein